MTFDELRDTYPDLGFALYALEPRGVVTLEVHEEGQVYPFIGATAREAIDTAFPPPELFNAEQPAEQPKQSVFD